MDTPKAIKRNKLTKKYFGLYNIRIDFVCAIIAIKIRTHGYTCSLTPKTPLPPFLFAFY